LSFVPLFAQRTSAWASWWTLGPCSCGSMRLLSSCTSARSGHVLAP
jgi:hypothetical protein